MPHIIVEYTASLQGNGFDVQDLLLGLHQKLASEGIDKARIKTRAIPIEHQCVGLDEASGRMVHATLLLLEGRDSATKKRYAAPLFSLLKQHAPGDCATTLEVRDMSKDTYYQ